MKCNHWGNVGVSYPYDNRVSCVRLPDATPFKCCTVCLKRYTQLDKRAVWDGWSPWLELVCRKLTPVIIPSDCQFCSDADFAAVGYLLSSGEACCLPCFIRLQIGELA